MGDVVAFTVIFLLDRIPPSKVVLLRRADDKRFAPGYYTGIGGKVGDLPEYAAETVIEGAYRELAEETLGDLTRDRIELFEFARCIYDTGERLHYFWGEYRYSALPRMDPSEGTLTWVRTGELRQRPFIPTTQAVCDAWVARGFRTDQTFTVYVRAVGSTNTVRLVEVQRIEPGLQP